MCPRSLSKAGAGNPSAALTVQLLEDRGCPMGLCLRDPPPWGLVCLQEGIPQAFPLLPSRLEQKRVLSCLAESGEIKF